MQVTLMLRVGFLLAKLGACISFDAKSHASVQSSTDLIVKGMLDYYPLASNDPGRRLGWSPGLFEQPYYWWEAGVVWGLLVDWQYLTNQTEYLDMIKEALIFQAGDAGNYMPSNQTLTEGNDDQGFWALAAMTAAERNFSNPDKSHHSWLYSAQVIFSEMKNRWETKKCGGGLRWQIYTWNSGYNYKNTVSNGCFLNLAARLAVYTGEPIYAEWAEKVFQWLVDVKFLNTSKGAWSVYDGGKMETNCTDITTIEWTYNTGLLLSSAAYMHEYTNGTGPWADRAKSIWAHAKDQFLQDNIVYESACHPSSCNTDQRCFKGIFIQHLAQTAVFLDELRADIMNVIHASANAAALSCSAGASKTVCGFNWLGKTFDNIVGLGEQITALSALINTQVLNFPKPLTKRTGATSNSNVNPTNDTDITGTEPLFLSHSPVSTSDKAGAGVLTAVLMIFLIVVGVWIVL